MPAQKRTVVLSGWVGMGRRDTGPTKARGSQIGYHKGGWFFGLSAGLALCPVCSAGASPASRAPILARERARTNCGCARLARRGTLRVTKAGGPPAARRPHHNGAGFSQ